MFTKIARVLLLTGFLGLSSSSTGSQSAGSNPGQQRENAAVDRSFESMTKDELLDVIKFLRLQNQELNAKLVELRAKLDATTSTERPPNGSSGAGPQEKTPRKDPQPVKPALLPTKPKLGSTPNQASSLVTRYDEFKNFTEIRTDLESVVSLEDCLAKYVTFFGGISFAAATTFDGQISDGARKNEQYLLYVGTWQPTQTMIQLISHERLLLSGDTIEILADDTRFELRRQLTDGRGKRISMSKDIRSKVTGKTVNVEINAYPYEISREQFNAMRSAKVVKIRWITDDTVTVSSAGLAKLELP